MLENDHPVISDQYLKPGLQLAPASQHKRFLNFLIDTYIFSFSIIFLWYFLILMFNIILSPQKLIITGVVLYILYYLVFEFMIGNTPAKYITNTKIVTSDSKQPSFLAILFRTLCRFIPLDLLSYITSGYPRGFHDRLSHTIVTDTSDNKLSPVHPLFGFLKLVFDLIVFCIIFILTFIAFRYLIVNFKPEMRTLKNVPAIISGEIDSLTQQKTAIVNFEEPVYGISLKYIDNWNRAGDLNNDLQPAILLVRSKKAFLRIGRPQNALKTENLDKSYAEEFLQIKPGRKIISYSEISINNRKYFKFHMTEKSEGQNVKILSFITFKDNLAYNFTYVGYEHEYEKYLPEAQAIINSINLK